MKKLIALSGAAIMAAAAFTATACNAPHTEHLWGGWHRNETEHWRVCTYKDCEAEERGEHTDLDGESTTFVCDDCAEFKALAFGFVSGGDSAHADFAREANEWFPAKGKELGFIYDSTTDFSLLNDDTLANYDLVMFLNNRPYAEDQMAAFQRFMENGGAWMGFHAAAFSMEGNNEYWEWYQTDFLGCGGYAKNTWDPTSEPLHIETYDHCATEGLDLTADEETLAQDSYWQNKELNLDEDTFLSAPCEWYGWESETGSDAGGGVHGVTSLYLNQDITVLLTLNPTPENPAGDDPRAGMSYQIWTDGHHPIAWANNNYKMVYMNWGHNLQSYDLGEEGKSSSTFSREVQNQFMLNAMFGLTAK